MAFHKQTAKHGSSLSGSKIHHRAPVPPVDLDPNAPWTVDWTDQSWLDRAIGGKIAILSPIRDQHNLDTCSCYAVSTALEAAYNILNRDKAPISLSVQELIDYDSSDFRTAGPGQLKTLAKFIRKSHLTQEMHYEYKKGKKFHIVFNINTSTVA